MHWRTEGDHLSLGFATASIVRAGEEIICKTVVSGQGSVISPVIQAGGLQTPAVQGRPFDFALSKNYVRTDFIPTKNGSQAVAPWSPKARDQGHPG